jgi:TonB family protein
MYNTDKFTSKYFLLSLAAHILCAAFLFFSLTFNQHKLPQTTAIDFIIEQSSLNTHIDQQKIATSRQHTPKKSKAVKSDQNKPEMSIANTISLNNPAEDVGEMNPHTESQSTGVMAKTPEQIYIAELKQFIDRKKKYPAVAKKMGQTGRVVIQFELDSEGNVISKKIVESSVYESLNSSTLSLIDRMGKFKRFPDLIKKTSWQFVVPVDYKL